MGGRDSRGRAAGGRPLKVKMISPAKTAADSVYWRSIKYSLFPPLGLATLAGYLDEDDEITLQDEHVEKLDLSDQPDLVVIEAYVTSAHRAYRYADHYRARGAYVCLGGLHPTSLPEEAAQHADSVFCGPGEDTWPAFLKDFRAGHPKPHYRSTVRTLAGMPRPRRDLIKRERYLVPNSLVVSRGCPHRCDFCYKETFFRGGRSFYVQAVEDALAEIDRLPGPPPLLPRRQPLRQPAVRRSALRRDARHGPRVAVGGDGAGRPAARPPREGRGERPAQPVHRLRDARRRESARRSTRRRTSAAATKPPSAACTSTASWSTRASCSAWTDDGPDVFARTVEWAVEQGIETSTFHILTPYPGTPLERRLTAQGRVTTHDWDRYDTRHAVFRPARMTAARARGGLLGRLPRVLPLERDLEAAFAHGDLREHVRHLAYTGGWKKLEPMWDLAIRSGKVHAFLPLLETILDRFGSGGGRCRRACSGRPGRAQACVARPAAPPDD